MMRRCALGVFLLMLSSAGVQAAELFYMDHDLLTGKYVGSVGPLVISGDIDAGDYARLLKKILADENKFLSQNRFIVASNGGDVGEAIKIGLLVQSLYAQVSVGPQTGPCVGACFLIYAAAQQRATDGDRLIGLHRPQLVDSLSTSLSVGEADAVEERALAHVRDFLAANDVPASLIEQMFKRSATDVYWLSEADEHALGFKSPAFDRYLKTRCGWDDQIEREVYAGKRPSSDLAQLLACRDRVTQADARKALNALKGSGGADHR